MDKWSKRFMEMADLVATWSKDPSTKVGAVLVSEHRTIIATGYNGLPRGLDDSRLDTLERPEKYLWVEHAERNALYDAARRGVSVKGADLYCTHPVCADCARGLIQAGVASVAYPTPNPMFVSRWQESMTVARKMLREARIIVRLM